MGGGYNYDAKRPGTGVSREAGARQRRWYREHMIDGTLARRLMHAGEAIHEAREQLAKVIAAQWPPVIDNEETRAKVSTEAVVIVAKAIDALVNGWKA